VPHLLITPARPAARTHPPGPRPDLGRRGRHRRHVARRDQAGRAGVVPARRDPSPRPAPALRRPRPLDRPRRVRGRVGPHARRHRETPAGRRVGRRVRHGRGPPLGRDQHAHAARQGRARRHPRAAGGHGGRRLPAGARTADRPPRRPARPTCGPCAGSTAWWTRPAVARRHYRATGRRWPASIRRRARPRSRPIRSRWREPAARWPPRGPGPGYDGIRRPSTSRARFVARPGQVDGRRHVGPLAPLRLPGPRRPPRLGPRPPPRRPRRGRPAKRSPHADPTSPPVPTRPPPGDPATPTTPTPPVPSGRSRYRSPHGDPTPPTTPTPPRRGDRSPSHSPHADPTPPTTATPPGRGHRGDRGRLPFALWSPGSAACAGATGVGRKGQLSAGGGGQPKAPASRSSAMRSWG
jgi:hypothetical protein